MTKRDIKETIREYDSDGHLVRETVTETHEEDFTTLTTTTTNWWEDTGRVAPLEYLYSNTCSASTEGGAVVTATEGTTVLN